MILRTLERRALLVCLVLAGLAAAAPFGGLRAAGGVLGGGVLAAISYFGLKSGVYGAVAGGRPRAATLVKFFTRHAILAVAAYVMLARLRLPVWAVAAGASSLVVAVAAAAVRASGSDARPGKSR